MKYANFSTTFFKKNQFFLSNPHLHLDFVTELEGASLSIGFYKECLQNRIEAASKKSASPKKNFGYGTQGCIVFVGQWVDCFFGCFP